ncbi:NAD(P)-dependent glycerol-1-phosphate dehydrogenase [Candidatus Bathyarchaeota archaeon]|nr:NAD(P)-dependent glycerol-1-phosphate dehydrogenase [Candidatus Bathyarchaeota archaeon]NIU80749.1 NAD(P)-dependent glycerol-1-phosphate dehydrogenase [Candidatus Bathyarchaeota archaeon]NIV67377.1 NAD(P)-dependent glycerol-1-phosphate dehydrogenase [Candidatus Bathyarchaeota archaeon]NIW15921.1 NAD(P)-dependent glycerol-1-phosphate dehydrogenase [Candidatus Bathyarchaeota archaeon]NIW34023.1 NAD(P)-dependent glycerol-1-phosphate dehydrogenase [Candidatus Bathyarchaeota archaeon]
MQLPREVIVGDKTLELVWDICRKLGFSNSALVVTGPNTRKIAGERIVDQLCDAGVETEYITVSSSTMWDVRAVEEKIRELTPQVVLGIGGGTKIDVAKLSSARRDLPFISIPTTASHDGIASPVASVKGQNKPYSITAQSPMAIIADTLVIVQASHRLVASGCGDVVSKFTSVNDWKLAHKVKGEYYGDYAASLALMSARLVVRNAEDIKPEREEGVRVLLEALISCGVAMSIAGSSRPCSGSEHLFSHALDVIAPDGAMHGEQCGVGAIMMAYLHGLDWKQIKTTLQKVGAPTTAEELGIAPESVIKALVEAQSIRPERYTILEKEKLDYESAEELTRATGVVE